MLLNFVPVSGSTFPDVGKLFLDWSLNSTPLVLISIFNVEKWVPGPRSKFTVHQITFLCQTRSDRDTFRPSHFIIIHVFLLYYQFACYIEKISLSMFKAMKLLLINNNEMDSQNYVTNLFFTFCWKMWRFLFSLSSNIDIYVVTLFSMIYCTWHALRSITHCDVTENE